MGVSNQPLLPDVGVLGVLPHHWNHHWHTWHQVLVRLARYFQVVWINPAPGWREGLKTLWNGNSKSCIPGTAQIMETTQVAGFTIYNPEVWLPKLYRPQWLAECTFTMRLNRARNFLARQGCRKIIVSIWHPEYKDALTSMPFDLSCYHIADEYSFSPVEIPIPDPEAQLLTTVDQVFIHTPGLLDKKGNINPHTTFVPNGVNYQAYAEPAAEPPDLAPIPRPRIGYTGSIKRQLDWPLLLRLTSQHPEWSFAFIGPQSPHQEIRDSIQELTRRQNVYFLGSKSTDDLATYPQHFDVCIMPYRMDDYTKYIYPLKLHEYLASGRPVVGAPIRSLLDFAHVVKLARTANDWSNALTDSLRPAACSDEQVQARRSVARNFDWDRLVALIAQTICERLGSDHSQQFQEIHQGTSEALAID